jgi:hypothetical protein
MNKIIEPEYTVINFLGEELLSGDKSSCISYAIWEFAEQHTSCLKVLSPNGDYIFINSNGHTTYLD